MDLVSIHAPTRGATIAFLSFLLSYSCFNPRTHEGCDFPTTPEPTSTPCFNPRTHEGCDICIMFKRNRINRFNPRTHEGCDLRNGTKRYVLDFVSIHAPTRGATAYSAKYRILIYKSSHFANINQTITFKVIKSLEFL